MRCVSCGQDNPKEMKFCTGCGASLAQLCPHCGAQNPPTARFCGQCATALDPGTAPDAIERADRKPSATIGTPTGGPAGAPPPQEAERRQLTIMFCDLVESTSLSGRLDPEELRRVLRDYHAMCSTIIRRYDGTVAQYLGDGLLVYFGYPRAHEDDAQRAVHTGVGIMEALDELNAKLTDELGVRLSLRLGIHTGMVVVGELGDESKREHLALGETPNVAARVQALAETGTVTITGTTFRLIEGFFECKDLGSHSLKGSSQPMRLYQVLHDSTARSRLEASDKTGFTPLVGRKQEIGLLFDRWEEVTEGVGQVVVLSGEAGVGKSRLVRILKEHVSGNPQAWLSSLQCSPYHQNSAFYPIIDMLERIVLQFSRNDTVRDRQAKLAGFLVQYGLPLPETLPLFAALLSVPLPEAYSPPTLSPERQKQEILTVLLTILLKRAAKQPLLLVVEDLHWIDPSTLELLNLIVDQGPTTGVLAVFTCRPDFDSPWTGRSYLTQVTLNRLTRRQVADMVARVAGGKVLPAELIEQIAVKTDGVPLFVEELTKMVLESGLLKDREGRYELSEPLPALAIPTTLHGSLMARLDRLATVKEVAQLAATLGREFTFELLKAVSPLEEKVLERELTQLVGAGLLYQQGVLPQASFIFKHSLIQEAAYQSLLKSKRQQYHRHIAEVLERQLTGMVDVQPELLAHHMTEAGLHERAVVCWQKAGEWAMQRSANVEAVSHLSTGRKLLNHLPPTPGRMQQELTLLLALGAALTVTKGWATPEAEDVYTRARALCQQEGDTGQLFPVLLALHRFYALRGELQGAHEVGEQLLRLARRADDPTLLLPAHVAHGYNCFFRGDLKLAREHLEQGMSFYDAQQHNFWISRWGEDPGIVGLGFGSLSLWSLGFPDKALAWSSEELALASKTTHPFSLAFSLWIAARLHQARREVEAVEERVKTLMEVSTEQGFLAWLGHGTILRGWALCMRGQGEEGIAQMQQGLAAELTAGANLHRTHYLALLAEAYGALGKHEDGLTTINDAIAIAAKTGEGYSEPELHRVKGVLLLQQSARDEREAEARFRQAIDLARGRSAKSLELRAATSLGRLWQSQGKTADAQRMLGETYAWFTDGFGTTDLQEAKALLEALAYPPAA